MSDLDHPQTAQDPSDTGTTKPPAADMFTLEFVFLGVVAAVVLWAFIDALSYALVSSRTPFVIMVPLVALMALQARRVSKRLASMRPGNRVRAALRGNYAKLNAAAGISVWMALLLIGIVIFGHYVGIFAFCFVLIRWLGAEKLWPALATAVVTTLVIYLVFEALFGIELYRGLIIRYFLGYRDF